MRTYRERLRNQSGMALVGVMLLLILASGVCAALAVSGKTETMAAFNLDSNAQARAAAQAGLTAAAEVLIEYLENTPLEVKPAMTGILVGPDGSASTLGDNGSLWSVGGAATGLPGPGTKELLNGITGVSYSVVALDDDDWAGRTISPAGSSANIVEDDAIYNDDNRRIVVRATGYGRNNTTVILEGIINRPQLGGIVVGADLRMGGTASSIIGASAGIHSNRDLLFTGNPVVAGPVTATGTITGTPASYTSLLPGQDTVEIPPINASDFLRYADWYLTSAGVVRKLVAGAWVDWCSSSCTTTANGGVSYAGGTWTIRPAANGRYYVQGPAQSGGDLTNVSIYATGQIDVGNNDDVIAHSLSKGVALVSDGNINIGGGANVTGSIYAREDVDFGGNHVIVGQVVAENRSNPAAENRFHGNTDIIWSGDTMIGSFGLSSWREVK
jgi:hypothetical protein